jgi:redox-sensitive bicupin YhaK (pirin superfamily)
MIEIRTFDRLGRFDNDWLSARYHFSFANYYDPARVGFGPLLVWNDDTIQPGRGFDLHGHRDMEIITYVREGAISHEDHLGNRGRTEAGDVQVMSAGTGILHAEYNLEAAPTRIFQIWIEPSRSGLAPRWEKRQFPKGKRSGALIALASGRNGGAPESDDAAEAADGALPIHQDAAILGATLDAGQRVTHRLDDGRRAYLVAARGAVEIAGATARERVNERDGATISGEPEITITALEDSEILLADLP